MVEHLPLGVDPVTSAAEMERSFPKASKISKSQKEMQQLKLPINGTNNDKKEKVKDTKKKKKKSKVALFIRAALSWFFFSPSYEPFRFPSSDDYEVNERRMVEKEEVKERMQEEEVVEKEMVMTEEEVVEKEEVEKNMKEKETITDIVRKEEVEERVVNRRRMTTRTIYSLKEEMNRKFPIQKQHMWPNNRPASKAQAARRGENRHILLWGQRKV
ncbi:uncharacterized protein isoform X5 [Danio rerio]|uniref:Uncharacterized protein isoform X5 n=1 Tax=Danio rerio TaxID=7955 RepID=A0AC58HR76_DANRE